MEPTNQGTKEVLDKLFNRCVILATDSVMEVADELSLGDRRERLAIRTSISHRWPHIG